MILRPIRDSVHYYPSLSSILDYRSSFHIVFIPSSSIFSSALLARFQRIPPDHTTLIVVVNCLQATVSHSSHLSSGINFSLCHLLCLIRVDSTFLEKGSTRPSEGARVSLLPWDTQSLSPRYRPLPKRQCSEREGRERKKHSSHPSNDFGRITEFTTNRGVLKSSNGLNLAFGCMRWGH